MLVEKFMNVFEHQSFILNFKVKNTQDSLWVKLMDITLRQYISLWVKLTDITLLEGVTDEITWNRTESGQYPSKFAYKAQFFAATLSPITSSVWRIWAPPKIKFFAWLAVQNRLWTNDRLEKRGWPNCGNCTLCKQVMESVDHLLVNCRYAIRLWGFIKDWLGLHSLDRLAWPTDSIHSWWGTMTKRKDLASVTLLVSWEIWSERNTRVFKNKHAPPLVILQKIKQESNL